MSKHRYTNMSALLPETKRMPESGMSHRAIEELKLEGNIRKRADGRWEGRYVAGHDGSGKPIRKNVLGKTQAEVKEKLKAALEECHRLDVSRADDFTVESWMRLWYETYSKPNIREATQERYWNHIQYHIIPEIGSIKLNKLTGRQVQTMYNLSLIHI